MPRSLRATAPVAVMVMAMLLVLAGCGSDPDPTDDPTSATSSSVSTPEALSKPWVLRLDYNTGPDGEARTVVYVSVVPTTGKASAVQMPEVKVSESLQSGWPLLLDAAQRWALVDSRPTESLRTTGRVVVRDLSDAGKQKVLDVRKASGDAGLVTDWTAFDPTEPGVMRVVSGTDVWKVDVADGTATREGSLPQKDGWIYGGGFDRRTGEPFIESINSFETDPKGNGSDKIRLFQRDGGRQIDTFDGWGDLPEPAKCQAGVGWRLDDGTTVAFCVGADTVVVRSLADGAKEWTEVGTSDPVVPGDADPQYAIPAAPD